MTIGKPVRHQGPQARHAPAAGASGLGADGEPDGSSADTLVTPGIEHWQATYVSKDGLEQRGNVFFAAIEMTRMPMIITNPRRPDNPIVFANSAFVELTGYRQSALLGRNCRFLQGPDTDPGTVAEIGRAIRAQRAVAVDILNYKADGTPFWNGLYLGPVFDSDGRLLYYFASQLDITEKTRQLQSSLQSQKMEAIGALTAGLAHDFNNLLHVVSGNLELATRQLHGAEVAIEALARSRSALDKATRLTQQLLTFARKQHLQPRLESLNQIVLALTDMLAPTLTPAVSLRLDLAPGLPQCRVDADHLQTALLNLVKNAREALADGGTITVSTRLLRSDPGSAPAEERGQAAADTGPRYVEVAIRDDGPGMTDDVMRRATEPFFTTKGPGTGLGLAMVHGFAEQSQGKLLIASTVGKGTTITLRFPAVAADYAGGAGARSGHDGAAAGADSRKEAGDQDRSQRSSNARSQARKEARRRQRNDECSEESSEESSEPGANQRSVQRGDQGSDEASEPGGKQRKVQRGDQGEDTDSDQRGDAGSDQHSDASSDHCSEASNDLDSGQLSDVSSDQYSDAASDQRSDASSDLYSDAAGDQRIDASSDRRSNAIRDARSGGDGNDPGRQRREDGNHGPDHVGGDQTGTEHSRWRAKRILIVDDNPEILLVTTEFLAAQGYTVEVASSGEQALELLAAGRPIDLLFTDIVMPDGMNGIDLARAVARRYPHIKLLAASGYTDQLPPQQAGLVLEIIPKPFRFDMLEEKVRRLVQ